MVPYHESHMFVLFVQYIVKRGVHVLDRIVHTKNGLSVLSV